MKEKLVNVALLIGTIIFSLPTPASSRVLKNAEFWRVLAPALIIVRWRAGFAVIYCRSDGAMVRGLMDVLDHGTS